MGIKEQFGKFKCLLGVHKLYLENEHEIMITGGNAVKGLSNVKTSHINGTRAMKKDWKCRRCEHKSSTVHIPGVSQHINI